MPNDSVLLGFIESLKTPEFIFIIGILIILAYVVVKALPMVENLESKKIEFNSKIEQMRIESDRKRDEQKSKEFQQELSRDRERIEMLSKQNEIMESLVRSSDSQTIQMSALIASIEESKKNGHNMDNTILDTNGKVTEIHDVIVKSSKSRR